jgi:hypothetical protein
LFDLVKIARSGDASKPARAFSDYTVTPIAEIKAACPAGVDAIEMV